jgi:hypothetical protein
MPALRSSSPVSSFAPVLLIGFALVAVLFLTPHSSVKPEEPAHQLVLEGNAEAVHRIFVKNGIVEDVLAGIITWNEAVERMIESSQSSPMALTNLNHVYPEGTLREQAARQLLTYIHIRSYEQPGVHDKALLVINDLAKEDVGDFVPELPDFKNGQRNRH